MSETAPLSSPLPDGDVNDCYSGINQDACADEPDITSTKDACEKINKKAKQLFLDSVGDADILDPITASAKVVDSIGKAFGASSESNSEVIQSVKEQNNSTVVQQLFNQCDASADASAQNIIMGQDKSCVEALVASGASIDEVRSTQANITQNATANATAGCSVQSMMENVASLKTSTDQQAVLQVLQEANGLFSGSSANTNFCSSIDVTNDTCSWMQTQNCCIAEANAQAVNLIDAGCLTDQANITQTAVSNASSTCSISSSGKNSFDMSNYISQKADAEITQKSTGLSTGVIVLLLVIILLGPVVCFIVSEFIGDAGKLLKDCGQAIANATQKGDTIGNTTQQVKPSNDVKTQPSGKKKTDAASSSAQVKVVGGQGVEWTGLILFMFSLVVSAGLCIFLAINALGYYNSTKVDAIDGMLNFPLSDCDSTSLSTMGDFAENLANPLNWPNLVSDLGIGDNKYVGTRSTYKDALYTFETNEKVNGMDFFVDRDQVATPSASPEGVEYEDPTGADDKNPIAGDNPPKDDQMGTVMYSDDLAYDPQTCSKIGGMNSDKFTTFTKSKATSGSILWKTLGISCIVVGVIMLGVLILFIVLAATMGKSSPDVKITNNTYNGQTSGAGREKPGR